MRTYNQTVYKCEYCGFTSVNKESVEHCEKCHKVIQDNVCFVKYSPKVKYPTTIVVLDADGNKITYSLEN